MATQTISYDPAIIQEFAQRLYRQAATIVAIWTFLGLIVGVVAGAAIAHASDSQGVVALVGLVLGCLFGFVIGRERAFKLKLQAQIALCQAQIERNTRGGQVANFR